MNFLANPLPTLPPRVVVTGAGIVTALGTGWKKNAEGFRAGKTAFRPVTMFDVSRQRVKFAAEVSLPEKMPATLLNARQSARLDRASALLLLAAVEAWQQSGWEPSDDIPVVFGTTSGGMPLGEDYFRQAVRTPRLHRRQPTRAFHYQAQSQGRIVLDALGLLGNPQQQIVILAAFEAGSKPARFQNNAPAVYAKMRNVVAGKQRIRRPIGLKVCRVTLIVFADLVLVGIDDIDIGPAINNQRVFEQRIR